MASVRVQYVGPFDEVEILATGQSARRGDVVSVDASVAGRTPAADGTDPGEGLLAQTTNWTPAPPAKSRTKDVV